MPYTGATARCAQRQEVTEARAGSPPESMHRYECRAARTVSRRSARSASRSPTAAIDDLRRRIAATRWPEHETVDDETQGVQLATIQALARYWADRVRLARGAEAAERLSAVPDRDRRRWTSTSSTCARSTTDALPLIVTHGWPGSIIEQLKIIGPLTDPTAHGASAADAFDVVIPSLPGHGFSGKPTETGWDPLRIARAWVMLMKRLGYDALRRPGRRLGQRRHRSRWPCRPAGAARHLTPTCPARSRPRSPRCWPTGRRHRPRCQPTSGAPGTSSTSSTRRAWATRNEMALRPQTLYGHRGLARRAGRLDARPRRRAATSSSPASSPASPEGLTRDDVLDNITHVLADEHRRCRRPASTGTTRDRDGRLLRRQGRPDPGRP